MLRDIIEINDDLCTGCGECVPGCHEGALQIIDGKARLISDMMCDGLGACVGHCPTGAMKVIKREAEPYDEKKVMKQNIIPAGKNTIIAHLNHLLDHNEMEFYSQALEVLKEEGISVDLNQAKQDTPEPSAGGCGGGCPGTLARTIDRLANEAEGGNAAPSSSSSSTGAQGSVASELQQWPVQMHLVSPRAPYFKGSDLLLAADCTAYAAGDFHSRHLKGKTLAIACPKLDSNQEIYSNKLTALIDEAQINTLTVMIMEVPCCGGLMAMAQAAVAKAQRKVPVKKIVISIDGAVQSEEWV